MAEESRRWRKPTIPAFGFTVETAAPDGRFGLSALVAEVGEAALWRGHLRETSDRLGMLVFDDLAEVDPRRVIQLMEAIEAATAAPRPGEVVVTGFADDTERVLVLLEPLLGISLRTLLVRDAPLDPASAIDLVGALAGAMVASHRDGACWGGIEPEFVVVRSDDEAFGVQVLPARLCQLAVGRTDSESLGIHGICYRAPEFFLGEAPTPATDVFSLGVILFELLVGEAPFEGHNIKTLVARLISTPVRRVSATTTFREAQAAAASPLAADEVAAIEAIIDRLTGKAPRERPADAEAALALLASLRPARAG